MRRILLVEPILYIHSEVLFKAALISSGFEKAHFTILTCTANEDYRQRLLKFENEHPNVEVRWLEKPPAPPKRRTDAWAATYRVVRAVEAILRKESFDLVAYTLVDHAIPVWALPFVRHWFPAHFAVGLRGIAFRNHGLRPTQSLENTRLKTRVSGYLDRFIFKRAITSGGVRKIAFFDYQAADHARRLFGEERCGYGLDPVEIHPHDGAEARARLGLPGDAFVALIFGALADRKGVVETLDILADAPMETDGVVLLIAGPVNPPIRDRLEAALRKVEKRYKVVFHEGFVPNENVPDYFSAADCVVCAYKNFQDSSGILLHAASFGKPAIVSEGGVMSDMIERYQFGEIVNLNRPKTLVDSFEKLRKLSPGERRDLGARALSYAQARDAKRFMAQFE